VPTSHQSRLVLTAMLGGMHHVHLDAPAVGSRIASNSFVNERLVLTNLTEFSCLCVCPHGVAIDAVKFQSFCAVARDFKAAHANRLAAEECSLALSAMRISFFGSWRSS